MVTLLFFFRQMQYNRRGPSNLWDPFIREALSLKKQVKILIGFLCFFFVCVFAYSGFRLFGILHDYSSAKKQHSGLSNQYVTAATANPGGVQYQNGSGVNTETSPISVDFDALLAQNPDVKAWLYSEGTTINYVVAQSSDNDYYLRRFLDGTYSTGGTLFIDWMCGGDFSSRNTVIYGHNMHDGSMFASLLSYQNDGYYEEHPVLYLNTPKQDYKIEVFAGFVTPATSDAYSIGFSSDEYYQSFLDKMCAQSDFQTDVEVTSEDRIVTLSTCSYVYSDARYVVMGKLVPIGGTVPDFSSAVG